MFLVPADTLATPVPFYEGLGWPILHFVIGCSSVSSLRYCAISYLAVRIYVRILRTIGSTSGFGMGWGMGWDVFDVLVVILFQACFGFGFLFKVRAALGWDWVWVGMFLMS